MVKLRFIITAGPTREHLDPVRFLSNPSTGRMGFAVARAAARRGHDVVLVAGPVALRTPHGVRRIDIVSARDMYEAVVTAIGSANDPDMTFFVSTAAVADWRPADQADSKLKKSQMSGVLKLVRNPDILATVGGCRKIGFAAETGDGLDEAARKCREKGAEMVVLNDVTASGAGFGSKTNIATFVQNDGRIARLPLMSKDALGMRIVRFCEQLAGGQGK